MIRKDLKPWTRFWRLVTTWETTYKWKNIYEKCICDCWNVKFISRWNLNHWNAKSCGCLAKEKCRETQAKYFTKHWLAHSRIYHIFQGIKTRTESKNHISYKYYWWKWIRCKWKTFEDFYKDMGDSYIEHIHKYWEKQTTIDRINWDWDYCKENCRRATRKEKMHNRKVYITT